MSDIIHTFQFNKIFTEKKFIKGLVFKTVIMTRKQLYLKIYKYSRKINFSSFMSRFIACMFTNFYWVYFETRDEFIDSLIKE